MLDSPELRRLRAPLGYEPTEEDKAAPHNLATDWIEHLTRRVRYWEEKSAHDDLGAIEAGELAQDFFGLSRLYVGHKREIQAWCDGEREAELKKVEARFLAITNHLDELAKEKRKEEQSRLDETKVRQLRADEDQRQREAPKLWKRIAS